MDKPACTHCGALGTGPPVRVPPPRTDTTDAVGVPTCPVCRSTNVQRITGGKKLGSLALVGPFALRKAMRSYRWKALQGDVLEEVP